MHMIRGFEKQGFPKRRFEFLLILSAGVAAAWINTAAAKDVYTWTDEDGVTHYTDTPPDSTVSETITVEDAYQPGTAGAYPPASGSENEAAVSASDVEGEIPTSAAQKRREEMAKTRKERREEQEKTDILCEKYRQRLEQVEPARRVFYADESGEYVRMDDDQRIGLVEESKDFIAKYCE
jgi:hypothetical protein